MVFENDPRIEAIVKHDDHDRRKTADLEFTYKGALVRVEVKSLQTSTVRAEGDAYTGRFQCDASDRREVRLPNGERLTTTCLVAGGFDLLAVNLFEFEQKWRFVFARSVDLPRSKYRGYTERQQKYLLATMMDVTFPPRPPFSEDPFPLIERIVRVRSRSTAPPRS